MKMTADYDNVRRTGTHDTSSATALTIDASGLAPILNTLTHQYSDPAMAVLREYTCNALDSHVEAGNPSPVEITLPSVFSPQLLIQDHGTGLTAEGLLNVFALYGASTKRDSNDYIGAMGIGSKSGFTVGNHFTVTAVRDGLKNIALFAKDDHGAPTVELLIRDSQTDEPNGVLIDVGVEDVNAVLRAAERLFYTFPKGSVLVDGEAPGNLWDADGLSLISSDEPYRIHMLKLDQNSSLTPANHFTFIMGGVSYPLVSTVFDKLPSNLQKFIGTFNRSLARFYVEVPIGSVDITPSREELRVTQHTTNTVERVATYLSKRWLSFVQNQLDSADTFTDAARAFRKNYLSLSISYGEELDWSWRGNKFSLKHDHLDYVNYSLLNKGGYTGGFVASKSEKLSVSINDEFDRITMVVGVDPKNMGVVKRYAKAWLMNNRDVYSKPILAISPLKSEQFNWFSYGVPGGINTISFEDFRDQGRQAMSIQTKGASSSKEVTYAVDYNDAQTNMTLNELRSERKVAYQYGMSRYRDSIRVAALKGYVVIHLSKNQKEATLIKRIPYAVTVDSVIKEYAKQELKKVTAEDLKLFDMNDLITANSQKLADWLIRNKDSITNQSVLDFVDQYQKASKVHDSSVSDRMRYISNLRVFAGLDLSSSRMPYDFISDQLPLFVDSVRYDHRFETNSKKVEHLLAYINAIG